MNGTRRRGVAALATALAAVGLAATVAGRNCGGHDDGPEQAVREFARAAAAGDEATMVALLGPRTRAWLDRSAERATHMVGGSRRYQPSDLMSTGGAGKLARISVGKRGGGRALVEVVDERGQRSTIEAIEVRGAWRLELVDAAEESPTSSEEPGAAVRPTSREGAAP